MEELIVPPNAVGLSLNRLVTDLQGIDKSGIQPVIVRVPCFLTVLEGDISLVGLHVVVVAELLERHLLPVSSPGWRTPASSSLVERTVPVLKGIASEHVSPGSSPSLSPAGGWKRSG